MNTFNVPKKVNRHVLKAVNILSGGNVRKRVPIATIQNQVKHQMRNLVPVQDIDRTVKNSLKHLSDAGLIARTGPNRFSIGRVCASPVTHPPRANVPNRTLFTPDSSRKRDASNLDPNLLRSHEQSEESLSGDEFDRARKRLRSNTRKLQKLGRLVELPKAKKHLQHFMGNAYECSDGRLGSGLGSFYDYSTTSLSELDDFNLGPEQYINMGVAFTTALSSERSLEITEIADKAQETDCYDDTKFGDNNNAVDTPACKENIEAVSDKSVSKVQVEVSASAAATNEKRIEQEESNANETSTAVTENVGKGLLPNLRELGVNK